MPNPLYSDVLPKSAEYGGLVFFLVAGLVGSMTLNVIFFMRVLKMMEKVIGYGERTNQTVKQLTEVVLEKAPE